jgi:hypothetical protein
MNDIRGNDMKAPKMTRDQAISKIAEAAGTDGATLMNLRDKLEPVFGKKAIDFSYDPVAHFRVQSPDGGKVILIASASHAEESDTVVGPIAIG